MTKKKLLFCTAGLACLGGAVFLELLVFYDIATQGYFLGKEPDPLILTAEISFSILALVFYLFVLHEFLRPEQR